MVRSKIVSLPISELVEDMDIYPRHAVDSANVRDLAVALESGARLPAVVADRKSKRIVDGWHRVRAIQRVVGPEAKIDVELVTYPNEAAIVFDAIQRNASHGRKLDAMDQTRAVLMLERHRFEPIKIAAALHVTEERVQKLAIKVASAPTSAPGTVPGTSTVTLKRSVSHLTGRTLTKKQAEVHQMLPGTSFALLAKQLANALVAKMVDLNDESLMDSLRILRDTLVKTLPE